MDPRDQFETMVTEGKKYFAKIMGVIFFSTHKEWPYVKNKWGSIFKEFEKIFYYNLKIGQDEDH